MSLFKRVSTTVFARLDESVRQIENHDAVISASLRETRQKVAHSKVRLNKLRAEKARQENKLRDLQDTEQQWVRRAAEQSEQDEETALACLRRRRDCQMQMESLEASIARYLGVEKQLTTDIAKLEQHLANISQQQHLLRTRQSAAEVNRCLKEIEEFGSINTDDVFERWEMQIVEHELPVEGTTINDNLEQRFTDEEELQALKDVLNIIKESQQRQGEG